MPKQVLPLHNDKAPEVPDMSSITARVQFMDDQRIKQLEALQAAHRQEIADNHNRMLECMQIFDKYVSDMK